MNKNIFKGNWDQFKGKLKSTWVKLSDDDLKVIEGNNQQIYGILQKHYGYTKDQVEQEIEKINRAA